MFKTIEKGYEVYLLEHLKYTVWIKNRKSTRFKRFLYCIGTMTKQYDSKWQAKLQGMEVALGLSEKEKRMS